MREKLATLPLTQLKELAKSQGIKNISGLRKAELIDRLCETAETPAQESVDTKPKNIESYPEHSVAIAVYPVGTQLDVLIGFLLNNGIEYAEL